MSQYPILSFSSSHHPTSNEASDRSEEEKWVIGTETTTRTDTIQSNTPSSSSYNQKHLKHFKILSYNLFMRPLVKTNASDYKDARLEELMMEWKSRRIDILCLQELFSTASYRSSRVLNEFCYKKNDHTNEEENVSENDSHCCYHYVHLQQDYWKLKPIDSGLFILSRFPIVERDAFIFSQGCDIDGYTTKGVIYARVDLQCETLSSKSTNEIPMNTHSKQCLVFNTHTQANYDLTNPKYWKIQQSQIIEIALFVSEKMKQHPSVPVLICGDFNVDARNRQEWYDWMMKTMNDIIFNENIRSEMANKYTLIRAPTVGLNDPGTETTRNVTSSSPHHTYHSDMNRQCNASCSNHDNIENVNTSSQTFLHDIILEHHKRHPITFGDVILDEDTKQEKPREIHLSHPHTLCTKQRLDYIFHIHQESSSSVCTKTRLECIKCYVEPFFRTPNHIMPCTQLSDHYSVYAEFCVVDDAVEQN
ncbi:hypothetical protein FDP41_008558 [Naegleria fowleri]|uniref:sphingomyelin phosphodiesterase n=1 Tax=Naegleria fowleri TaxID=5763 RepID=A0A6A5BFU0_NAEFO|nr:uncharacterized protein FDP41_008558 [Naegleria fowleri]KAF0973351.1 hypothetical protein FDP41_008558 [Naegleria fowleri]CAG4710936.1 unnamed protein product [Naegleria fowleri]